MKAILARAKKILKRHPTRSAVLALLILGCLTRIPYFWLPDQAVFDEVYFNKFATSYYAGEYYYDIHPPLGKLVLAAVSLPIGLELSDVPEHIGSVYETNAYMLLRLVPVLAGALLPVTMYYFIRELGLSHLAAFAMGIFIVLENALITQSRLTLLDSMLILAGFASLWLFLRYRRTKRVFPDLTLAIIAAGTAASIKWTGMPFLALGLIVYFFDFVNAKKLDTNKRNLFINVALGLTGLAGLSILAASYTGLELPINIILLGVAVVVCLTMVIDAFKKKQLQWRYAYVAAGSILGAGAIYVASFAIHFSLLPKTGEGDAFMSPEFQKTLEGSRYQSQEEGTVGGYVDRKGNFVEQRTYALEEPNLVEKIIEINKVMYSTNQALGASHPYSSEWYEWPLMIRPVFYWVDDDQFLYFFGNPVLWWSATGAAIVGITNLLFRKDFQRDWRLWWLVLAVVANWLPFVFVDRVMFVYHYTHAYVFSLVILVLLVDASKHRKKIFTGIGAAATACFLFFAPLTYGLPFSEEAFKLRKWLRTWR